MRRRTSWLSRTEAAWLPPWRELLRVYRRMEARGEIRGGRFIAGLSGEQFALPEAVGALREIRRRENHDEEVSLSAVDGPDPGASRFQISITPQNSPNCLSPHPLA